MCESLGAEGDSKEYIGECNIIGINKKLKTL